LQKGLKDGGFLIMRTVINVEVYGLGFGVKVGIILSKRH
jgi:hypothetical protein